MKVMISYFNNIRHFTPNMIPLSTAMWDPKWYRKDNEVYVDKRGVINGLRANKLVLSPYTWSGLEQNGEQCGHVCKFFNDVNNEDYSTWCPFMKLYLEQLRQIDFKDMMDWLKIICYKMAELRNDFPNVIDYIPVLIVHEKPDRKCSERWVLKQWFKENGYELEEVKCQ